MISDSSNITEMDLESVPPINAEYWSTFYQTNEDDDEVYEEALTESNTLVDRAAQLWDWKDLSRGVPFDAVQPTLESIDVNRYLEMDSDAAVEALGQRFVSDGALANATVVAPAFVLHVADSDWGAYSQRFPIFDARVWTAFVYLTDRRDGSDRLPAGATTSTSKYGEFVDFFRRTIPDHIDGRTYERGLFSFGSYIDGLAVENISEIREHIENMEAVISDYADATDSYLTRV
ncbi:hypothetical protein [Halobacteriaceae bacterium SHR40]|uniref:hypothetical protein n=1 Tax=Halovenus amylolytica TaxID=2500550 RepID=UPI000FE37D0D